MIYKDGGLISCDSGRARLAPDGGGVPSLFHPSYVSHLTNMVNGRARVPLAAWLTSRVCGSLKGAVPGARDGCSLGSGVEHCLATSPSAC